MNLTIFISTAGTGSRLEHLTKFQNKSLVSVNHKPIISHIIENIPKESNLVVALGHKGDYVKQYLKLVYPKHKIKFIKILKYSGEGSGLGLTLFKSKSKLQKPFLFIPCDTIVFNQKIKLDENYLGYKKINNNGQYRSIKSKKNNLIKILEKSNFKKKINAYTGIVFVKDFKNFWKNADQKNKKFIEQGETFLINKSIEDKTINYKLKKLNWFDTGNKRALKNFEQKFKNNKLRILRKEKEDIYFINDIVVKFSVDEKFIIDRIKRAKYLKPFIPKIIKKSKNFYIYKKIEGSVYADKVSKNNYAIFFNFCKKLWKVKKLKANQKTKFKKRCCDFYKIKTFERVKKYLANTRTKESNTFINGKKIKPILEILKKVDWKELSNGVPGRFHGDFHFENIIFSKNSFHLIDWRQNFGGGIEFGDIYYDLAKLMHGLLVSHEIVEKNQYKVTNSENKYKVSIKYKKKLLKFKFAFEKWLEENNYSKKRVMILTALIYLNISPLHHYPYNNFLFLYGKKMLSDLVE